MGILSAFRFSFQNLFFSPILYGVIASLAVFSAIWEGGDRLKDQLTDRYRSQDDTFDFIIVGAGSAGAVLANRLSQSHNVLLLESGGETHPFQAIPGLSIFIPKHSGTDWMHKSVTQTKSCLACPDKKYTLSQGKNLGGSGNLNYMIHMRGNHLDFANWGTIVGPSWAYQEILSYFIKSENFIGETTDNYAHGYGGPLQIQIPDWIGLANEWNSAGVEMGYPHVDLNGRYSEGFDTIYYPIKRGIRQATYRSYIQPVRNRPSLLIRKFAHVNKILIRGNAVQAVEYDRHGHRKLAYASKEVILSAGTLQTPKLLILSGIGQLEHLNALRIPPKSILPVGKNLQDHFSTLLGPFYIEKGRTVSLDRDIDKQSFINFALNGKGPLSSTGFTATAVLTSAYAKAEGLAGWPDIQLTLFGWTPHRMFYSDIGHAFGIREDILHKYYGDVDGKENAFFIMVTLARPHSKGEYCLASKNPYKPPTIVPNYLTDPAGQDVKVMIEGIHRALFIAENTTSFNALGTHYSTKCFPGCEDYPFRSDAYWECYIRSFSIANNDHVGTCAMGKVGSPYAVVDPELQVQGIKGLRVVDASVMPTIVGAPTQAATIMIAEKASSLILDKYKQDAKVFYGPPSAKPVPAVQQYGPPSTNVAYGPPPFSGNNIGPQYGPPGIKPAPISGGDGFENYDSFSVIRDQLNPTIPGSTGPTPTPLIPLNPNNVQLWSTPTPFPNAAASVTPVPPLIGGLSSTPSPPILSPEPAVVLVPPETYLNSPSPTFATSYSTSNIGPIVSSTPSYPVSYNLDTSRSEKTFVASDGKSTNVTTGSRQGKSFGDDTSSTISPLIDGNQLGVGLDDAPTPSSTSTSSPFYATSTRNSATPIPVVQTTVTETEIITQGPGFKVVRKRIRPTPSVVVHPRGHLGHQNVQRIEKPINETLENLFLTTSSVRPVPKEIVKIRKRRPVSGKRRRTTTPSPIPEAGVSVYLRNALEQSSASRPSEFPSELNSPQKKRFVRRMYARPLNFNGRGRLTNLNNHNDLIAQATTASAIVVPGTLRYENIHERIDLDSVAGTSAEKEIHTDNPLAFEDTGGPEEESYEEYEEGNLTTEQPASFSLNATEIIKENATEQPIVVFKSIELENIEELGRQTREVNNNGYFNYLLTEESRNPIMRVDLSPIPEIVAPEKVMQNNLKAGVYETVAVDMNPSDEASQTETEETSKEKREQNESDEATTMPAEENEDVDVSYSKSFEDYSTEETIDHPASSNLNDGVSKTVPVENSTIVDNNDNYKSKNTSSVRVVVLPSYFNQTVTSVSVTSTVSQKRGATPSKDIVKAISKGAPKNSPETTTPANLSNS